MIMYFNVMIIGFLLSIVIPFGFKKDISLIGSIFWSYLVANAAWVSYSAWYDPSSYIHPLIIPAVRDSAKLSLWLLFCVPIGVMLFKNKILNIIKLGLVVNSAHVLAFGYGVFNAGTFDAGVMAASLPLFASRSYKKLNFIMGLFVLASVISTRSATGAVVLLVVLISYMSIWKSYLYAAAAAFVSFGVSFLLQGSELFNDSGRIIAWKNYIKWWSSEANILFGTGVSTFDSICSFIDNGTGTIFVWAHNDYLQLLIDGGIIGVSLFAVYYLSILFKVRNNPVLFSCLAGFGACGLTYSPMHFVASQVIVCYLLIKAEEYAKRLPSEGYRRNQKTIHLW
jgi:hypothetical protein